MEVSFQDQTISFLRELRSDAVYREETAEILLPDSLPEADRIIDCSGTVLLSSKEAENGKATASGEIRICVLYLQCDSEQLQKAEKALRFSLSAPVAGLLPEHFVSCSLWLKKADARLLGTRKLLVRANVGACFTAFLPETVTVRVPQAPPKPLQLLKTGYQLSLASFCGEREFRMNEEASLPQTSEGISKILKTDTAFRVTESKTVGDKAVFKAELMVHLLYESAAGTLHCFDAELPFSQFVEVSGEAVNGDARITVVPLSCEIDTDGRESSDRLLVSCSALAQAAVYDTVQTELIEDAYVTRGMLEAQWAELPVRPQLDCQTLNASGELTADIAAERIVDAGLLADAPVFRHDGSRLKAIVPLHSDIIYCDPDGRLQGKEARGELVFETALSEDASCFASSVFCEQPVCLASYDTVTVRAAGRLVLDSFSGEKLRTLSAAKITNDKEKHGAAPSLIVRRADAQSVWEIAKKSGSTVSAICEANGLKNGVLQEGSILLIPMQ